MVNKKTKVKTVEYYTVKDNIKPTHTISNVKDGNSYIIYQKHIKYWWVRPVVLRIVIVNYLGFLSSSWSSLSTSHKIRIIGIISASVIALIIKFF